MISDILDKHTKFLRKDDGRAGFYHEKWHEWAPHEIDLSKLKESQLRLVRQKLRGIGLYEWEDYIYKGRRLRFHHAHDCAMCKLVNFA